MGDHTTMFDVARISQAGAGLLTGAALALKMRPTTGPSASTSKSSSSHSPDEREDEARLRISEVTQCRDQGTESADGRIDLLILHHQATTERDSIGIRSFSTLMLPFPPPPVSADTATSKSTRVTSRPARLSASTYQPSCSRVLSSLRLARVPSASRMIPTWLSMR